MFNDKLSFPSNNVKEIKASEKRLKLFEYFRNCFRNSSRVCVSPRNTLLANVEKMERRFPRTIFFSHGKEILVESP